MGREQHNNVISQSSLSTLLLKYFDSEADVEQVLHFIKNNDVIIYGLDVNTIINTDTDETRLDNDRSLLVIVTQDDLNDEIKMEAYVRSFAQLCGGSKIEPKKVLDWFALSFKEKTKIKFYCGEKASSSRSHFTEINNESMGIQFPYVGKLEIVNSALRVHQRYIFATELDATIDLKAIKKKLTAFIPVTIVDDFWDRIQEMNVIFTGSFVLHCLQSTIDHKVNWEPNDLDIIMSSNFGTNAMEVIKGLGEEVVIIQDKRQEEVYPAFSVTTFQIRGYKKIQLIDVYTESSLHSIKQFDLTTNMCWMNQTSVFVDFYDDTIHQRFYEVTDPKTIRNSVSRTKVRIQKYTDRGYKYLGEINNTRGNPLVKIAIKSDENHEPNDNDLWKEFTTKYNAGPIEIQQEIFALQSKIKKNVGNLKNEATKLAKQRFHFQELEGLGFTGILAQHDILIEKQMESIYKKSCTEKARMKGLCKLDTRFECKICCNEDVSIALQCGHLIGASCSKTLRKCPYCNSHLYEGCGRKIYLA